MVGDFFNEYLRDDYNALDGELNGTQWFQKQEEHIQQQMMQQNRPESEESSELPSTVETPIKAPTESPFRNTFDRKKQTESRKERLERIKQEYSVPYISVSNLQRRKRRKQQVEKLMREQNAPEHLLGEDVKDGLAANTPGFTQLVEENEPTTTPLSSMGSKNRCFCKKAISFENDPEAAEWFAQEKQRVEPKEDIEELAKEMGIEPEELEEWFKSAGGKRFCKRAIKR